MVEQLAPEDLVEDEWADVSVSSLAPGTHLGRYELLIPVAYGGMARVWAARQHGHRGFTKLVAIKTILPHLAREPEFERMFQDEARIASRIHHPNVCEIYELGEEGNVLYLAMEWVNGDSLVHVVRPGRAPAAPIDPRIAARIVADACAGLHAAHNIVDEDGRPLHVVHRDVSPHNILVSLEGTVKVADFGVAKALGQVHHATKAGQIKGKISYMAPEQITGTRIDCRSDVYSAGCLLYEITTGRLPFRGENEPQIMQAVMKGAYAPPSQVVSGYPIELQQIIQRALMPEPRHRFASAERMRIALAEWLVRSGPIVTEAHVGALVRERLGAMLDKRREHIRAASTQVPDRSAGYVIASAEGHTPSRAGVASQSRSGVVATPISSSRESQAPPLPERAQPSSSGATAATSESLVPPTALPSTHAPTNAVSYCIAAALGVIAAGFLAGAALFAYRAMGPTAPAVVVTSSNAPVAVASPVRAPEPATTTSSAGALPASPASPDNAKESFIELRVAPDQATLVVDGVAQRPGVRTLKRPRVGASVRLVIQAPGFVEQAYTLDDQAPPVIDIMLDDGKSPAALAPVPRVPVLVPKPSATTAPALPDNPY